MKARAEWCDDPAFDESELNVAVLLPADESRVRRAMTERRAEWLLDFEDRCEIDDRIRLSVLVRPGGPGSTWVVISESGFGDGDESCRRRDEHTEMWEIRLAHLSEIVDR